MLSIKPIFAVTTLLALALPVQGAPERPKHMGNAEIPHALMNAALYGNLRKMQVLLSQGADINATGEDGENALVSAVDGGQSRSVDFLLDHGVSATDKNGVEALFTAVDEGQTGIVRSLIKHGANVNARGEVGDTPLMIACFYDPGEDDAFGQSADIVKLLLAQGADVHIKDHSGKTALMYLANKPSARIHNMLLAAGEKK